VTVSDLQGSTSVLSHMLVNSGETAMPSHTLYVVEAFEERDGGVVPAELSGHQSAAERRNGHHAAPHAR
jgi:hypothetical protein